MRTDVYQKITDQIVAALEVDVRPWHQPWKTEHAAGRITRPLRCNGIPYQGINVLMLWSAAIEKGYVAPIWMTFKQALDLKANVRKGEHGSLVVYADKIIRTETDAETGEEAERAIPFMKGYTVFNVEQLDGLPEHYYAKPEARTDSVQRIAHAESFFAGTGANVVHGGTRWRSSGAGRCRSGPVARRAATAFCQNREVFPKASQNERASPQVPGDFWSLSEFSRFYWWAQ